MPKKRQSSNTSNRVTYSSLFFQFACVNTWTNLLLIRNLTLDTMKFKNTFFPHSNWIFQRNNWNVNQFYSPSFFLCQYRYRCLGSRCFHFLCHKCLLFFFAFKFMKYENLKMKKKNHKNISEQKSFSSTFLITKNY